jgi:nucleoside-diphosphate-sugar epimerase
MSTVLVTGGSGFIGSHCNPAAPGGGTSGAHHGKESPSARVTYAPCCNEGGAEPGDRLILRRVPIWKTTRAGRKPSPVANIVLHVASPFPPNVPKHEDELIVPACEGALRVLRASRDAGVKRVVLTSSFAAIGYGQKRQEYAVQRDETGTDHRMALMCVTAYVKSKTLAERAAWDFIAQEGRATSSFPWSIRWACSARSWVLTIQPRS